MEEYDTIDLRESGRNDIDRISLIWYFVYLVFTYSLLNPWSKVILQNLSGFQPVNKFPAIYGTRRFITAFTSTRHLSLSWANSIQFILPHPASWRSILSSPLRLGVPSGLFPASFPHQTLYTLLFSPYSLHVPPISVLDLNTLTVLCEEYRLLRFPLCSFLNSSYVLFSHRISRKPGNSVISWSDVPWRQYITWLSSSYSCTVLRFPAGAKIYSLLQVLRTGSETHPTSPFLCVNVNCTTATGCQHNSS